RLHSAGEPSAGEDARGCRCIMIDVSGEQKSARKLRQLQSQLAHMTRLNTAGELASSLAHELNQPLGTVMLNCEAALRLLNDGAAREYEFAEALIQAREAASFASDVVRHLRGFLRNNEEPQTICALPTLIQDVSTLIRADARDNDIELRLEVEPDLPPVHVDSVQIEQVLLNLAHNSIEAMHGNGGHKRVTINASAEALNRIRVTVADTGPGLGANQLDRLFTPFYTTKRDGMGMGLSISRTIIEAHGGQLWAAAAPGPGATIHFTLPAIDGQQHDP
ncbi:MAG: sensor histidine kinase, partial [Rhodanobacteraceae bacterium]